MRDLRDRPALVLNLDARLQLANEGVRESTRATVWYARELAVAKRQLEVATDILEGRPGEPDGRLRGLASIDEPLRTITTSGGHAVVVPHIVNTRNGEREGQAPRVRSVDQPMPTITALGSQGAVCAAFLAKHNGSGEKWNAAIGQALDAPVHTITGRDTKALAAVHLTKFYGTSSGADIDAPLGTVTAGAGGGHHGLVAAFICKYYGSGGQWSALDEPLHTIVAKARMGLVTVTIEGEEYAIVDIAMRMLDPDELLAAQFGPARAARYRMVGTKAQQTAGIGNSVNPDVAEALARAQLTAPAPKMAPRPVQMPIFRSDQEAA